MKRGPAFRQGPAAVGLAALLFLSCSTSPRTAPPSPPGHARRAVLISFDGVAGTRLTRLMKEGKLPAYGRLAGRGFFAERSQPPTPSLTAVSHITIATGALPQATGIVSNTMLDPGKPFPATISGFDAPIRADTLWEAARRQGRRVGVIAYPGTDGKAPERTADWAMIYTEGRIAEAKLQTPDAASWKAGEGQVPGSFSPPRRLTLSFGRSAHAVSFVALDGSDDGKINYDHLRVEPETGEPAVIAPGDWFPVETRPEGGRTGAWCKLLSLSPDLSKTEIYLGGLYKNAAYPEELRRTLDERIGFWPGPADHTAFGANSAHPEAFLEQAERFADFFTRADLLAIARPDWDLLLLYQPEVDEVEHEFFLADPRQAGYTLERSARFQGFIDRIYAAADRELDRIEQALTPSDAIFVVSDHGMAPVWSEISLNEILRQGGFLRLTAENKVDASSSAVAVVSGGIAHVYLNKDAPPDTLERIEKRIANFQLAGASPWDRVLRRREASSLGLDAPESGDLIVIAKPGFVFATRLREGVTTGNPPELGMHGYVNVYPEIDASFVCAGPGIPKERIGQIRSWEIARRVSRALGMDPPTGAN